MRYNCDVWTTTEKQKSDFNQQSNIRAHFKHKLDCNENKVNRNITNFKNAPQSVIAIPNDKFGDPIFKTLTK